MYTCTFLLKLQKAATTVLSNIMKHYYFILAQNLNIYNFIGEIKKLPWQRMVQNFLTQ